MSDTVYFIHVPKGYHIGYSYIRLGDKSVSMRCSLRCLSQYSNSLPTNLSRDIEHHKKGEKYEEHLFPDALIRGVDW